MTTRGRRVDPLRPAGMVPAMPFRPLRSLAVIFVTPLVACGGPTAIRDGKAIIRAPSQSACTRSRGLSVVPTRVFAQASDSSGGFGYTVVTTEEVAITGLGIYREGDLQLLPRVLPELDDDELAALHLQRIEPIQRKIDNRDLWAAITLGLDAAALASLGVAVVGLVEEDDDLTIGGFVASGGFLTGALFGLIPTLLYTPGRQEKLYYDVRQRVLLEGEDDLDAALQAVDRYNAQVEVQCRERGR